ncbi:hypothetical protein [Streptomyces sp. NBC_00690]|uniref:hypothetical protein n=1 Tax=Streptomyces sp. NBC_00690 TaxID=2975808 RepID=UPI002E29980B|nr:hypothetical protein [Streptomyces sp. NBC_00690]
MTCFTILDQLLNKTEVRPEEIRHQAILDTSRASQQANARLLEALAEHLDRADRELAVLFASHHCCCPENEEDPLQEGFDDSGSHHGEVAYGDPGTRDAPDLLAGLRLLPGTVEGRGRYADLTPARLAQLLSTYGIATRDVTLPDGRRRASYRRAALTEVLGCC